MNDSTPPTVAACNDPHPFVGQEWKVVVTGRKALNGEQYSMTITGVVEEAAEGESIFDALRSLADHIEIESAEMEYPDSIRVTFPIGVDIGGRGELAKESLKSESV